MSDISIFNESDVYLLLGICSVGAGFLLTIALVVINFFTGKEQKFSYYIMMYFIYCILSFITACLLYAVKFF